MQNPTCPRSFVWGSSGSHQVTASGASANKYPGVTGPGSQRAAALGQRQTYRCAHPNLGWDEAEGQVFQISPISTSESWPRRDHGWRASVVHAGLWRGTRRQLLQTGCNLDLPSGETSKQRKERASGPAIVQKSSPSMQKQLPKATL